MNRDELIDNSLYPFLYPSLDDPNFNIKIAKRKEFMILKLILKLKTYKKKQIKFVILLLN